MSNCYNSTTQEQALADILAQDTAIFDRLQQVIQAVQAGGNSGIINGLTYPLVDGAAGDVVTTDGAGNLTLQTPASSGSAKQFPLERAVYVDLDAATLAAQGILAYTTISAAVASWRPGGAAQLLYGTPVGGNRGAILIGQGIFSEAAQIDIDVSFLDLIGTSREGTVIATSSVGRVIYITSEGINFYNMTIQDSGTALTAVVDTDISAAVVNCMTNVIIYQLTAGVGITSQSGLSGKYTNCLFVNLVGDFIAIGFNNGTFASDAVFEDCFFSPQPGCNSCVQMGRQMNFTFKSCQLQGDAAQLILIDDGGFGPGGWGVTGKAIGCTFTNGSGFGINVVSGDCQPILVGCSFNTTSVALNGIGPSIRIFDCNVQVITVDTDAINIAASGTVIRGGRMLGNGTGLAVNGGAFNAEITGATLRMPTGDVPGSSVSATLVLSPAFASAFNAELLSATVV